MPNSIAPVLNRAGQTAFLAGLTGTDSGIFSEGGGLGLALVARTGASAPGTTSGVNFLAFNVPILNGAGQTAFFGFLTGTGVDVSNDRGIWATDRDGLLTLIARAGDMFDVDDDPLVDDFRTISFLGLVSDSGSEDGRPNSFNDVGQLAFQLAFTDGSQGIFVANTVPEPRTLLLVGLASVGASACARRRRADSLLHG